MEINTWEVQANPRAFVVFRQDPGQSSSQISKGAGA